MDPNIIILISFIIFMALAFRYGYKKSLAALDEQIDQIRDRLDDAVRQKQDALALLSEQRQAYSEALNLAESLEAQSQEQLRNVRKSLMHDLEQLVRKKESDLQDLMKRYGQEMVCDIQREVGELTQTVLTQYAKDVLTDRDHEKLNDAAVDEVILTLNIANGAPQGATDAQQMKKPKADWGVVK
jgi:F-type H+-transporting ATPase subunit b